MTSFATCRFPLPNDFFRKYTVSYGDLYNSQPVHFRLNLRLPLDPLGEKLLDEFREVLPGAFIF
jgi:hypothetical protein